SDGTPGCGGRTWSWTSETTATGALPGPGPPLARVGHRVRVLARLPVGPRTDDHEDVPAIGVQRGTRPSRRARRAEESRWRLRSCMRRTRSVITTSRASRA